MVYGAALERRFTRKGIQGSNPCPSAIFLFVHIIFLGLWKQIVEG